MAKYCVRWTETFERIVERKTIEDAAQHAKFAVAQKPGAVLLAVEEIKEVTDAGGKTQ